MGAHAPDSISQLTLPPGFRFYPTDEELLVQYLCRKVAGQPFSVQVIGEIDLYKFDPWILPSKATFGEKEWYFFSPRDRKYPNGTRPNRVAGSGYWKATGTDKLITAEGRRVGIKKALVFYVGKAPKGAKTNWIMHEYRLIEHSRKNGSARLDDWVLCRIYEKKSSAEKAGVLSRDPCTLAFSSYRIEDMLDSLPEMDPRSAGGRPLRRDGEDDETKRRFSIQSLGSDSFDWASIAAGSAMSEFMIQPPLTRAPAPGTADVGVDGDYGSVYGGAHPATASRVGPVVDDAQGGNGAPGGLPPCCNTGAVTQADALGHFGVSYPPPPSSCFGFTRR